MEYEFVAISEDQTPQAADPAYQHLVDTYVSEANKVVSIWREVSDDLLDYSPHEKSNDVRTIMTHQLLSERRFFAQFVGTEEPDVDSLLPANQSPKVQDYIDKYLEQIHLRLPQLARADQAWWLSEMPFFDMTRQRIWIFWRRVLHTAHHRTQAQIYLRLSGQKVPATYGPSGDVTWDGADPTTSKEAADRP
jgi:uncharacterized damage-inducible protein DinB